MLSRALLKVVVVAVARRRVTSKKGSQHLLKAFSEQEIHFHHGIILHVPIRCDQCIFERVSPRHAARSQGQKNC
jgi:hypothetical protein